MIRAILFDLDGTLLHSAPDLVGALNWVRGQHGLPAMPLETLQRFASRGAVGLLKAGMPEADENEFEEWRRLFLERYATESYKQSSLFEGTAELLAFLGEESIPWGVVTNKPEDLTLPILSASGLSNTIGCVVCGDTIPQNKPHPAPVLLACKILGVSPQETLFVGDDLRDIEAGRAAGVVTCAAMYGYGSWELSEAANAPLVADGLAVRHPAELVAWLREHRADHGV